MAKAEEIADVGKKYIVCPWFSQVYEFQRSNILPLGLDRLHKKRFIQKGRNFQIFSGELFIKIREKWKRCVPKGEVNKVLYKAHDQGGHYQVNMTLKKLKQYYWPKMSLDTRDYILGCLECGRNGTARRTQSQASPRVDEPMVLLGMDFIGPLPHTTLTLEETIRCCYPHLQYFKFELEAKKYYGYSGKNSFTHVFMAIDYFSRFFWAFPCAAPDQAEAIRCLIWLFGLFGNPIAIYADIGSHFTGSQMAKILQSQKVLYIPAPSAAKRATGMIVKTNDLFERVMKGMASKPEWLIYVHRAAYEFNRREIRHLGYSPYEILFGYNPPSSLKLEITHMKRSKLLLELQKFDFDNVESDEIMAEAVFHHVAKVEAIKSETLRKDDWRRLVQKEKHDLGVWQRWEYIPGSYINYFESKFFSIMVGMNNAQLESYMKRSVEDLKKKSQQLREMLEGFENDTKEVKDSVKTMSETLNSFKDFQIEQTKSLQNTVDNVTELLLTLNRQFQNVKEKSKETELKQLDVRRKLNLRLDTMQINLSKQVTDSLSLVPNASKRQAREMVRTSDKESKLRRSSLPPSRHGKSSSTNTSFQIAELQRSNLYSFSQSSEKSGTLGNNPNSNVVEKSRSSEDQNNKSKSKSEVRNLTPPLELVNPLRPIQFFDQPIVNCPSEREPDGSINLYRPLMPNIGKLKDQERFNRRYFPDFFLRMDAEDPNGPLREVSKRNQAVFPPTCNLKDANAETLDTLNLMQPSRVVIEMDDDFAIKRRLITYYSFDWASTVEAILKVLNENGALGSPLRIFARLHPKSIETAVDFAKR
ncbi:hypothetical protein EPUL_005768, partial [Erysiphe pulchra]